MRCIETIAIDCMYELDCMINNNMRCIETPMKAFLEEYGVDK